MPHSRCVVVLVGSEEPSSPPPGVLAQEWRYALAEDVIDLVSQMEEVDCVIASSSADLPTAQELSWPGQSLLTLDPPTPQAIFVALTQAGYQQAALICADAPDLPLMLCGKLFRGLGRHPMAVIPSPQGLVALAVQLPLENWLEPLTLSLEKTTVEELQRVAPQRKSVSITPGWHRLCSPVDIHLLDPGLEGWDRTRELLTGSARR